MQFLLENDKAEYASIIEKSRMTSLLTKLESKNNETSNFRFKTDLENEKIRSLSLKKDALPTHELNKKESIMEEIRTSKIRRDYYRSEFDKSEKSLQELYKELGLGDIVRKNSIFDIISEKIENLDTIGLIGFSLLLGSNVIISCLISIIFVFYGDILLKKYKIEENYPNLAKIINLRLKFQRYYLILAILYIFSIAICQLLFGLFVLSR
jgi:hypothetical protein